MVECVFTEDDVLYTFTAIENGHVGIVQDFIHDYPDAIDYRIEGGRTLLMHACHFNKPKIVELLIKKGARLNLKDDEGFSALHHAAFLSSPDIFKLLLQAGACFRGENGAPDIEQYLDDLSPLHPELQEAKKAFHAFIAPQRQLEIAELLAKVGAAQQDIPNPGITLRPQRRMRLNP